jgi:hypothetical protein
VTDVLKGLRDLAQLCGRVLLRYALHTPSGLFSRCIYKPHLCAREHAYIARVCVRACESVRVSMSVWVSVSV